MIKNPDIFASARAPVDDDVSGIKFLEQVAKTNAGVRRARFSKKDCRRPRLYSP
ncbi:MAG: hypothetical protein ACLQMF_01005 [Rectinemataceae bacterium]